MFEGRPPRNTFGNDPPRVLGFCNVLGLHCFGSMVLKRWETIGMFFFCLINRWRHSICFRFHRLSSKTIVNVNDFVLTFRPSCEDPTATRSARCWDQRTFCLQTIWTIIFNAQHLDEMTLTWTRSLSSDPSRCSSSPHSRWLHRSGWSIAASCPESSPSSSRRRKASWNHRHRESERVLIERTAKFYQLMKKKKLSHHQKNECFRDSIFEK